jgi:hypothetical protein
MGLINDFNRAAGGAVDFVTGRADDKQAKRNASKKRASFYKSLASYRTKIADDETIDRQSKGEFLSMLDAYDPEKALAGKTGVGEAAVSYGNFISGIDKEYQKAVEGIDPKYKSRKNVEEYYKAIVDKPGARQTRSPDMLLSNAFNGVGR